MKKIERKSFKEFSENEQMDLLARRYMIELIKFNTVKKGGIRDCFSSTNGVICFPNEIYRSCESPVDKRNKFSHSFAALTKSAFGEEFFDIYGSFSPYQKLGDLQTLYCFYKYQKFVMDNFNSKRSINNRANTNLLIDIFSHYRNEFPFYDYAKNIRFKKANIRLEEVYFGKNIKINNEEISTKQLQNYIQEIVARHIPNNKSK